MLTKNQTKMTSFEKLLAVINTIPNIDDRRNLLFALSEYITDDINKIKQETTLNGTNSTENLKKIN